MATIDDNAHVDYNPWGIDRVSKLIKDWIKTKKRHGPGSPGPISPDGLDIAYNGAHDILERCVPGSNNYGPPPPPKQPSQIENSQPPGQPPVNMPPALNPPPSGRRRWTVNLRALFYSVKNVYKRQGKVQETLIFENGHLTDPKYSDQVSPLDCHLHLFHWASPMGIPLY